MITPVVHGQSPAWRAKRYPQTNNDMTANALEVRSANLAPSKTINGMTTGNVDRTTRIQTPNAPSQSRPVRPGTSEGGIWLIRSRINSNCVDRKIDPRNGGNSSAIMRCASSAAFTNAGHQIHSTINDSPSQVATEGSEKHCPNLEMIGRRDADRACDG